MNFYKYHGAGNDFVIISLLSDSDTPSAEAPTSLAPLPLSSDQCRAVCDRHFGIGADGVLFAAPGINVYLGFSCDSTAGHVDNLNRVNMCRAAIL
jgi:diaminopimelate epimerase